MLEINFIELIKGLKVLGQIKANKEKEFKQVTENYYIRVAAGSNKLVLTRANLDTTCNYYLNLEDVAIENFEIAINTNTVKTLLKMPVGLLKIDLEKFYIDNKSLSFKDQGYNKNIAIDYSSIEKNNTYSTTEKELNRLLQVSYAAATNDSRPILKGIHFNQNEVVALDGYRIALRSTKDFNIENSFTVKLDTINFINSFIDIKKNNSVSIELFNNVVKFTIDNIEVLSNVIEGNYIKYSSFFNTVDIFNNSKNKFKVTDIKEFRKDLDLLSNIENPHFNKPILEIKVKKENVILEAFSVDNKLSIEKKIDINNYDLDATICLNTRYLKETLKNYNDFCYICQQSQVDPILITEDVDNFDVILPVRKVV